MKPCEFTETQKSAYETINSFLKTSEQLALRFSLHQLKKAYRKAALSHHPDLASGSHESFLAIKESYEILLAFFATIK